SGYRSPVQGSVELEVSCRGGESSLAERIPHREYRLQYSGGETKASPSLSCHEGKDFHEPWHTDAKRFRKGEDDGRHRYDRNRRSDCRTGCRPDFLRVRGNP